MTNAVLRVMLGVGVAIGLAGLATACDEDGGSMSMGEYFQEFEELGDESDAKSDEINEQSDDIGPGEFDKLRDLTEDARDVLEDFINDVDELDPPAEVEDAHDRFLDAASGFVDEFDDIIREFFDEDDEDALADGAAALNAVDFSAVGGACDELQQLANDNGIDVDLGCDE